MKFATIVGARPQFIKTAIISNLLRGYHSEVLIHTGQHYDLNMSDVFFDQLNIPMPDYNLEIGSASHGIQTAAMLEKIEKILLSEKPDMVIVYGDTNSTLAGALAAVKLHIPIAHVEAGLRSFNNRMPEEINRILTDRISSLLFCPTKTAVDNLKNEGIIDGVLNAGDVMLDVLNKLLPIAEKSSKIVELLSLKAENYFLLTLHRAENTSDSNDIAKLLLALRELEQKVIWPMHPRTRAFIRNSALNDVLDNTNNLAVIDPIGYLDMLKLLNNCKKLLTDSGGMQKEAFWLRKPCITLRSETEWVETVDVGWNVIVGMNSEKIIKACNYFNPNSDSPDVFGNGTASELIVEKLVLG